MRNPKQLPLKHPLVSFRKDTNFSFTHQIPSTWERTSTYPALQRNETNQPFVTRFCSSTNGKTDVIFPNHKTKEEIPKLANFYHFCQLLSLVVGRQRRTVKLRVYKSKKTYYPFFWGEIQADEPVPTIHEKKLYGFLLLILMGAPRNRLAFFMKAGRFGIHHNP